MSRVFDPIAAQNILHRRFVTGLYECYFEPFSRLVRECQIDMASVPMKKASKNKAKVFRIGPKIGKEYMEHMQDSVHSVLALQKTMDEILVQIGVKYPSCYEDIKAMIFDDIDRWKNTMPSKLVDRTDEGVVGYMERMRLRTEDCLLEMFPIEMQVVGV